MPRLIDQAKAAKAKADAAEKRRAAEVRQQKIHDLAELKMVADDRAKQDYPKWKRRVLASARAGETYRLLRPFDNIYGDHKAVTHHWEDWGKTHDKLRDHTDLQVAYVYALGEFFYQDGMKVAYDVGGENVFDYGYVEHCDLKVSWDG